MSWSRTPRSFNSTSWQPPGTPAAPEAIAWPQLVTGELRRFTAAGHPLLTLSTINRYGHGGNTPPNEPPDGPLDIPAREDAFFTYCGSRIAGGTWLGRPGVVGAAGQPEHRLR
jgi:hypothetical protein